MNLKLKGLTHISGTEKASMKSAFENALETAEQELKIDAPKSMYAKIDYRGDMNILL